MAQWFTNLTSIHEGGSLALLSGLRILRCYNLQCRLKMWFGSGIAVDVV